MARQVRQVKTYNLPEKREGGTVDLSDVSMLLYGREGAGKTSFAANFPDAFFILTEPGAKRLSLYKADAGSWGDIAGWIRSVVQSDRFGTVVIDTIDIAYDYCQRHVCKRQGIDHPADKEWGAGWDGCKREFASVMIPLLNSGRGVIFISHETERQIERRGGNRETRILPSLTKTGTKVIEPAVDLVVYYGVKSDRRYLQLAPDDVVFAKNRWADDFNVDEIDAGKSAGECYTNFVAAFNGKRTVAAPAKAGGMRAKARKD